LLLLLVAGRVAFALLLLLVVVVVVYAPVDTYCAASHKQERTLHNLSLFRLED
jgi:hypothetical protein